MKAWWRFVFVKQTVLEEWLEFFPEKNICHAKIPKKIWIYWESMCENDLVNLCIENIIDLHPDYEVNVLNKSNLKDYVELPNFNKNIETAVIADYIRLSLLKDFGGIWLDASIFLVENLDWILKKMKSNQTFVFYSDECTINKSLPIIENWLIISEPNNIFINDWFEEFSKCFTSNDPKKYYKDYANKTDLIQNIGNTDYLMCYISAAIIMNKKQYNILTVNSGSHGHYYNYFYISNGFIIALYLLIFSENRENSPKLIKFTKETRNMTNLFLRKGFFSKKSTLGKIYHKKKFLIKKDKI
ncbi:glycosyltransferase family 32 protein [Acinetobacter ihumii]|uniref:glycosyltransferase family 32 protein n=1 Tax=Acinetobacter ihumii TaxID=2483802 RepID=UPI0013EF5A8B|nr:capsular polysaccharide synthesis protein [Acinetobacter ihumii]